MKILKNIYKNFGSSIGMSTRIWKIPVEMTDIIPRDMADEFP